MRLAVLGGGCDRRSFKVLAIPGAGMFEVWATKLIFVAPPLRGRPSSVVSCCPVGQGGQRAASVHAGRGLVYPFSHPIV